MKSASFVRLIPFGISTILFRRKQPILGTIILTDRCNLSCKHCSVNNINSVLYPYTDIHRQMQQLYDMGVRILFFCGGEPFLWKDGDHSLRSLILEAKAMGFNFVTIVTNGTFPIDLPEADLILLSLDGDEARHNTIRGETYARILQNIRDASADNICFFMAVNKINKDCIQKVCQLAKDEANVRAVSFNFHTPYPETTALALSASERAACCQTIDRLILAGYPVFNLRSALPYICANNFPTPCYQVVVMEQDKLWVCGRCIDVAGLCEKCGYFFAAEYTLAFRGNLKVAIEMLRRFPQFFRRAS